MSVLATIFLLTAAGFLFLRCRRLQRDLARQAVLIDDQARVIRLLRLRAAAETEWPEYINAD